MKLISKYLAVISATILAAGILLVSGTSGRADSHAADSRPRGRDIVRMGSLTTLTGPLKLEKGEWSVVVNDKEYELHLGNHEYRRRIGLQLEAGQEAVASGFVYGHDVAVTTLVVDSREYRFRKDDGTPLWAGLAEGAGSGKEGGGGGAGRSDATRDGAGRVDGGGGGAGRGRSQ